MAPSLVFPPNLKHPFFIESITSPSASSLKDLSGWGFSPAKVASQCLQVYLFLGPAWAWEEWVKEAGFWVLSSQIVPPTTILSPFTSFLLQVTSGKSSGTRSQDASTLAPAVGVVGPSASPSPPEDTARPGVVEVKVSVQSASSPVYLLRSVVFAVQGELVWVFECRCLLFFKGLLALPWGYCSRNSYLCFSPAYRLLTGTKWKTPAHSVLSVNMFSRPWFPALCPSVLFFMLYLFVFNLFCILGKPSGCKYCNIFKFFFHELPMCLCWI